MMRRARRTVARSMSRTASCRHALAARDSRVVGAEGGLGPPNLVGRRGEHFVDDRYLARVDTHTSIESESPQRPGLFAEGLKVGEVGRDRSRRRSDPSGSARGDDRRSRHQQFQTLSARDDTKVSREIDLAELKEGDTRRPGDLEHPIKAGRGLDQR